MELGSGFVFVLFLFALGVGFLIRFLIRTALKLGGSDAAKDAGIKLLKKWISS